MARAKPEVEWIYNPSTFWKEYGLLCIAGKWAVVKASIYLDEEFEVVTDWLDSRQAAIGFLKLLKEN